MPNGTTSCLHRSSGSVKYRTNRPAALSVGRPGTFGPNLVIADFTDYWVYIAGPLLGAAIAVGFAFVLRGQGGGGAGSAAAQGALFT